MTIKSGKIAFVSEIPEGFSYSFVPNLYNLPDHLALINEKNRKSFYIIHITRKQVLGNINFIYNNVEAISLPQRPFGSFEFAENLRPYLIDSFISWVQLQLQQDLIKLVKIVGYSPIYGEKNNQNIVFFLYSKHFVVSEVQINHHLIVSNKHFSELINRHEHKRLKKCIREGYIYQEESHLKLKEVYDFICGCRKERGQPISISYPDLLISKETFPDRYLIFSVRHNEKIIAASISVVVTNDILYDFMHASQSKYNNFSPIVFLLNGIYSYCQKKSFRYLDLGVSSVKNIPQVSLLRFKENIGGIPTVKIAFTKKLNQ